MPTLTLMLLMAIEDKKPAKRLQGAHDDGRSAGVEEAGDGSGAAARIVIAHVLMSHVHALNRCVMMCLPCMVMTFCLRP